MSGLLRNNFYLRYKRTTDPVLLSLIFLYLIQKACNTLLSPEKNENKVINISSRLELFVDNLMVDKLTNLEFRLHEPRKLPLPESPVTGYYITVIKDSSLYRAWYRSLDPSYTGPSDYSGHPGEVNLLPNHLFMTWRN